TLAVHCGWPRWASGCFEAVNDSGRVSRREHCDRVRTSWQTVMRFGSWRLARTHAVKECVARLPLDGKSRFQARQAARNLECLGAPAIRYIELAKVGEVDGHARVELHRAPKMKLRFRRTRLPQCVAVPGVGQDESDRGRHVQQLRVKPAER